MDVNIVQVLKKNGVCIDFKNLIYATSNNKYQMWMVDMLIDSAIVNEILSFIDIHLWYK